MEDPKDEYLIEIFNLAFVLHGELKELEEIKYYIIEEYHNKKLVKLLKPTYAKEKLVIVKKLNYSNPLSEYHCDFTGCKE